MNIPLEYPYKEDHIKSFLTMNKEPRRVVLLQKKDGTRTSTSYARYIMSVALGRYLTNEEEVDHIDDDKLNDVISNLQILTPKENRAKNRTKTYVELLCPGCNTPFIREKNQTHLSKGGYFSSCSRKCGNMARKVGCNNKKALTNLGANQFIREFKE